ncbi:hypothetical protein [Nocardia salmonicida]|uniref:hypothetical protein n=1 Tax=Nocardia salmonicida TaxID=53431 RepID=UPI0037B6B681
MARTDFDHEPEPAQLVAARARAAAAPTDIAAQLELIRALTASVGSDVPAVRRDSARVALQEALAIGRALHRADPTNGEAEEELDVTLAKAAEMASETDDSEAEHPLLAELVQLRRHHRSREPGNPAWSIALADALVLHASAVADCRGDNESRPIIDEGVEIYRWATATYGWPDFVWRNFSLALFRSAVIAINLGLDSSISTAQLIEAAEIWRKHGENRGRWPQLAEMLHRAAVRVESYDRRSARKCRSLARRLEE